MLLLFCFSFLNHLIKSEKLNLRIKNQLSFQHLIPPVNDGIQSNQHLQKYFNFEKYSFWLFIQFSVRVTYEINELQHL
jgi:hypothetical protein